VATKVIMGRRLAALGRTLEGERLMYEALEAANASGSQSLLLEARIAVGAFHNAVREYKTAEKHLQVREPMCTRPRGVQSCI
jgi:hypothetical protein